MAKIRNSLLGTLTAIVLAGCGGANSSSETLNAPTTKGDAVVDISVSNPDGGYAPLREIITTKCTDYDGKLLACTVRDSNGKVVTEMNPTLLETTAYTVSATGDSGKTVTSSPIGIIVKRDQLGFWKDLSSESDGKSGFYGADLKADINGEFVGSENTTQFFAATETLADLTYSPDGSKAAYTTSVSNGRFAVFLANADDWTNQKDITSSLVSGARHPSFCLSGLHKGEIVVDYTDSSGNHGLGIISADLTQITPVYIGGAGNPPTEPVFNNDCSEIIFQDETSNLSGVSYNGSARRSLTSNLDINASPYVLPDNQGLIYSRKGSVTNGEADLYFMNMDGSGYRPLTTAPGDEIDPSSSSDGSYIFFAQQNLGGPMVIKGAKYSEIGNPDNWVPFTDGLVNARFPAFRHRSE